ncbi:glycosyltransferase family 2 protein [Euzebya tangerina]|uniref:glycosyltransferase family 2 protein n=1 Tax=Euzebya tangerina TaxID=591198 RepID=UPI000E30DDEF|nr:glycosyltransferase family 2 protein [Euzebya tangerina]
MRVTVCVVSYNTADHLAAALTSLLDQTHPDLHLVVVDNNSHDGSADIARRFSDVEVIANRRNLGYTGAANQALARAADGGFFLVTPDVRLDPGHIAALATGLEARPHAASVQGRLHRMRPDGSVVTVDGQPMIDSAGHSAHTNRVFRNRGDGLPDDGSYDDPVEIFGVTGAAALHRVAALHDIALDGEVFDDDLFAFFEDVDIDWRLKARGWQAWYLPDAVGRHERGGEGARRSRLVERLSYRNWFLTVAKNDDPGSLLRHWHLLGATTALRTADLALTVPLAFLGAVRDLADPRSTLRKRRLAEAHRTVPNAEIVARWFEPFDYRAWVAKRIRRGW